MRRGVRYLESLQIDSPHGADLPDIGERGSPIPSLNDLKHVTEDYGASSTVDDANLSSVFSRIRALSIKFREPAHRAVDYTRLSDQKELLFPARALPQSLNALGARAGPRRTGATRSPADPRHRIFP